MLEAALQQLGWGWERGCYELSVGNPDKGVLPVEEVLQRLQQFRADHLPIVVTHVRNAVVPALQLQVWWLPCMLHWCH